MILPFSALLWAGHTLYRARGFRARPLAAGARRALLYLREGQGKGPPALLVHGLGGNAASWLKLVAPLLRLCRAVGAIELPGHGRAGLAMGEAPASPVDFAAMLARALDDIAARHGPAVLIGNSLGGALVLDAAARSPARVAGVVALSPAGAPLDLAERKALLHAYRGGPGTLPDMARRLYHRPPRALWLFARDLERIWGSPAVQHVLAQLPADEAPGLAPEVLEAIACPTLVLWGDSDRLLPPSSISFFRRHLGAGRVEVVERCGHVPQLERPGLVADRVARFLTDLPSRGRLDRAESA